MKKVFLTLTVALFMTLCTSAQQDGVALAKTADRSLTSYKIDPSNNSNKLEEAINLIEQALKTQGAQSLSSAWLTKGNIYNTRLQKDMASIMIDLNAALSGDNDALDAFEAYKKVLSISDKNYEKLYAIKGIMEVQGHLINIGFSKYEAGAYENAFLSFRASLESHDLLKTNSKNSLLDDPEQLESQVYYTGLVAMNAERYNDAFVYLDKLYRTGTDKPVVYENLFNCKQQMGDAAGAARILAEGRKKFPDDSGLLFAEINEYLKAGKLEELTGRLKQAIAKEPNNIGLYVTLGNVYDNLYQKEQKNNNKKTANEYFEEAKNYYLQAITKDPKNADAAYSAGALYYNKASSLSQEMNALPEDFSAAGIKKFETLKTEFIGLFDQALPYFKRAESLNPNDLNTLIALVEIFLRKEDEQLSQEFKKRMETVKAGGKNKSSYFH